MVPIKEGLKAMDHISPKYQVQSGGQQYQRSGLFQLANMGP